MDWLALAMVSPVAMLAAALSLRWAHGRGLEMPGVATATLFGMTLASATRPALGRSSHSGRPSCPRPTRRPSTNGRSG